MKRNRGKIWAETIQDFPFNINSMEYRSWNPELDTLKSRLCLPGACLRGFLKNSYWKIIYLQDVIEIDYKAWFLYVIDRIYTKPVQFYQVSYLSMYLLNNYQNEYKFCLIWWYLNVCLGLLHILSFPSSCQHRWELSGNYPNFQQIW